MQLLAIISGFTPQYTIIKFHVTCSPHLYLSYATDDMLPNEPATDFFLASLTAPDSNMTQMLTGYGKGQAGNHCFLEKDKYSPSLKLVHDIARVFNATIEEAFLFDD